MSVTLFDLSSKFGCVEMEAAAAIIVNKGEKAHLYPEDFLDGDENHHALHGFVMLVAYGWVQTADIEFGNGCFIAEPAFWKRVHEKKRKRK